jgi:transcription elongation factor Elf1
MEVTMTTHITISQVKCPQCQSVKVVQMTGVKEIKKFGGSVVYLNCKDCGEKIIGRIEK